LEGKKEKHKLIMWKKSTLKSKILLGKTEGKILRTDCFEVRQKKKRQ
jgi:hypothetical protein